MKNSGLLATPEIVSFSKLLSRFKQLSNIPDARLEIYIFQKNLSVSKLGCSRGVEMVSRNAEIEDSSNMKQGNRREGEVSK